MFGAQTESITAMAGLPSTVGVPVTHSTSIQTPRKELAMPNHRQPPAESANSAILTKQQAAAYVQATPRYLERMVREGRLRALKPTGKLWRVRRRDLDAFLESGATIQNQGVEA
jgi:excisionase family DNA binding protein